MTGDERLLFLFALCGLIYLVGLLAWLTVVLRELAELVRFLIYGQATSTQRKVSMNAYLPSRKVLAAVLLALVGTVFLVASGDASLETLGAVWAPVAAAYSISEKT